MKRIFRYAAALLSLLILLCLFAYIWVCSIGYSTYRTMHHGRVSYSGIWDLGLSTLQRIPAPTQQWDIPTDPFDKAAYDYAHSRKVPESVPKTVPFAFCKKTRAGYCAEISPPREYWEHLCKTEAGEFILKTVENVEGVYQMRPREHHYGGDNFQISRFRPEDPFGYSNREAEDAPMQFVNPPWQSYSFFETSLEPQRAFNQIFNPQTTKWVKAESNSTGKYWRYSGYSQVEKSPMLVEPADSLQSRYGYTWRGIRRERDREFGVAGGELIVIDLQTQEIIAVFRGFAFTGMAKDTPDGTLWDNAVVCPTRGHKYGIKHGGDMNYRLISNALKPININPKDSGVLDGNK